MAKETRTYGVRLSAEEEAVIQEAIKLDMSLGDRGGLSSWMRRVALREAQRILAEKKTEQPA